METNDKLMTLLRLMDEPEAMTEAQLQELLSDEEVRKAYDVMADCKKVYQREKLHTPTLPSRHGQIAQRRGWIYRIAAVFLGAVLLCGLAWAIIPHIISSHTDSPQPVQVNTPLLGRGGGGSSVRFDDVRLDSILTVVSAHYGKAVSFRDEEAKSMKFIMTWDPDRPLSDFIDGLNLFDGLSLTLQRDTIFVETTEDKESI
ncbi:MAG: DUF4974 domain-containing protein [Prevotella sp.]|nr:DUF4974 domain-containing protein [Prevotella sp.]